MNVVLHYPPTQSYTCTDYIAGDLASNLKGVYTYKSVQASHIWFCWNSQMNITCACSKELSQNVSRCLPGKGRTHWVYPMGCTCCPWCFSIPRGEGSKVDAKKRLYVTRWVKTQYILHFEKIELRPEIITAIFDLATEWISKRLVFQLPRCSLKLTPHTWNYFSCKFLTLLCRSAYYPCYVSSIVSASTHSECSFSHLVVISVTHPHEL